MTDATDTGRGSIAVYGRSIKTMIILIVDSIGCFYTRALSVDEPQNTSSEGTRKVTPPN